MMVDVPSIKHHPSAPRPRDSLADLLTPEDIFRTEQHFAARRTVNTPLLSEFTSMSLEGVQTTCIHTRINIRVDRGTRTIEQGRGHHCQGC